MLVDRDDSGFTVCFFVGEVVIVAYPVTNNFVTVGHVQVYPCQRALVADESV